MKKLIAIICLFLIIVVLADDIVEYVVDQYNLIMEEIHNNINDNLWVDIDNLYLEDESEE